jgi:hypothetical protein
MLPADVLKKVNELLERLHLADKDHQGTTVINYYAPGSQYVDKQFVFGTHPQPLPDGRGDGNPPPSEGRGTGGDSLPEVLGTEEAMALWKKMQAAGYVDEHYQPLISRTQAALLADAMAERLGIKEKWKVFEGLWGRKNMYKDLYYALNQKQSLVFQDKLKVILR